ncbi:MAG: hypothetical protein U5K69_03970 [Balneolaceae bacterium]|nr:hypothetical protein [Balneolaceae bacterium]
MEEVVDDETGEVTEALNREVLLERDHELTEDDYGLIKEADADKVYVQTMEPEESERSVMMNTLRKDTRTIVLKQHSEKYTSRFAPEKCPIRKQHGRFWNDLFFSDKKYDLGEVGRYRLNKRLKQDVDMDIRYLIKEDIVAIVKEVIRLKNMKSQVDDIDHLSNRRVSYRLVNNLDNSFLSVLRGCRERLKNE